MHSTDGALGCRQSCLAWGIRQWVGVVLLVFIIIEVMVVCCRGVKVLHIAVRVLVGVGAMTTDDPGIRATTAIDDVYCSTGSCDNRE